eukprot:scaffold61939_cov18-Tisochrysis_lutea.AAC.1
MGAGTRLCSLGCVRRRGTRLARLDSAAALRSGAHGPHRDPQNGNSVNVKPQWECDQFSYNLQYCTAHKGLKWICKRVRSWHAGHVCVRVCVCVGHGRCRVASQPVRKAIKAPILCAKSAESEKQIVGDESCHG